MGNDDLIRRGDVIKELWKPFDFNRAEIDHNIRYIPAVDAVEVRHLAWAHLGGDEWLCPACGHVISTEGSWEHPLVVGKKFCENCGARMDERKEEVQK